MTSIIILAGGESVKQFDVKTINQLDCHVIGVNDACLYAPVDSIVSMDRLWMEHRFDKLRALNKPTYLRYSAFNKNLTGEYFPALRLYACDHETPVFSKIVQQLNGRNSGYVALNLAYTMFPDRIFLLGYDMQGGHWWKPYPWTPEPKGKRCDKWINDFKHAERQCHALGVKLYTVGETAIKNIENLTYKEFLEKCGK